MCHNQRAHPVSWAEACAWAEVLVRYHLLNAAVPVPGGQWLVQYRPRGPVEVLSGPTAVLALAARLQRQSRSERNCER
jgi:hypothetical protein